MIPALLPVIFIEAYVIAGKLKIEMASAGPPVAFANAVSTLIGIPFTWLILFALQLTMGGANAYGLDSIWHKLLAITIQAPWQRPYGNDSVWVVYAAELFLLIPFFFASWFIEYKFMWKNLAKRVYAFRSTLNNEEAFDTDLKNIMIENYASEINTAVRNANLISYGALVLLVVVFFVAKLDANKIKQDT